ncbi:LysR family transcriptional regulator [Providencia sp. wls1943]|uniref:LysR family transcriptional regulator n=1 Tax=Providencia sp. wls1943 TaxID=2675150 RepID=UPI0012B55628|nr:LysR family transcriptional regulator [Providencia sp. wls1943]MTB65712.1 LysR family transcriptional regulator [Providencia sp. wls1943]
MDKTKTTLDQWITLQAVVDYGGFAQAAEVLHKTQSSISYTISKLEQILDIEIFVVEKRRAVLTEQGESLLALSREVTNKAIALEIAAKLINKKINNKIKIIIDSLYNSDDLLNKIGSLIKSRKDYDVELTKTLLNREDILSSKDFDLLISHHYVSSLNPIFLGEVDAVLVTEPNHYLQRCTKDKIRHKLEKTPHIVLSTTFQDKIRSHQTVKVTNTETAIKLTRNSVGYSCFPRDIIHELIEENILKEVENDIFNFRYQFYMYRNKSPIINDIIINYLFNGYETN